MNQEIEAYINELSANLQGLPEDERQETEEFYREYLLDGKLYSRSSIEQKLGTSQQLARKILADYSLNLDEPPTHPINHQRSQSDLRAVWWIILGILAMPVGIPILSALLGIIVATISVICALIIGFWGLIFALAGIGLTIVVKAIPLLWTQWQVGLFYTGCGLVALALVALIVPMLIHLIRIVIDASFQLIRRLGHKVFKNQYYQTASKEKHQQ
ncbi:hypothetical protein DS832_04600 [Bombilactobacillus bombi]|uniref:DUF1700 domain-containing protein n=1 Tax=Bombilactobacillus bombi TaxID=1303590 RepID=A0A417Z9U5_9LACO|nr:DUF1700 domain-containing protein [Bombilactobacillus bombi]RHW47430.1 hypothetical protein DS832_04600 [Bombilactobacillus bombi]